MGLQNSGKTTLVNLLAAGSFSPDTIPTVGFNMRKVRKNNVVMKLWDLGGQARFRSMWERYCRGVNAIVFVVDSADKPKLAAAKKELYDLLARDQLRHIPLLILANKSDLDGALTADDLIKELCVFPFSLFWAFSAGYHLTPWHPTTFKRPRKFNPSPYNYSALDQGTLDRELQVYSVSAKENSNIDLMLQWLIAHSKSGGIKAS